MPVITINEKDVKLSNLTKIFWPESSYTKGDMINYYIEIYPYIKNFLYNRPLSLLIYPDGIEGKSFFQKNAPDYAPSWLTTYSMYSGHKREKINWIMANKLEDLIWVANRASIELHTWFSTVDTPENPDFAVFDLDPGHNSGIKETVEVARLIKRILDEAKLVSFIKTSGKRGLHIYIPVKKMYTYKEIKKFLKKVGEMVVGFKPELATLAWRKKERGGKVYIDYRQNGRGKTLPAPYSLRPTPKATVSAPLSWPEVNSQLDPEYFTINNIKNRLQKRGDLWSGILARKQELPGFFL